ncbi:uncharacterized protein LOC116122132 [Pistacia vera]|uniref:uncharacterized protein LOC116122132 n=1 Tax=Pistacia vera TaxID=55513 RepID=UPI001262E3CE|nr:uncharacterized protein LOC116122132 [Pistacia vera]
MLALTCNYVVKAVMASKLLYEECNDTLEANHQKWKAIETVKEDALARAKLAEKEKKARSADLERLKGEVATFQVKEREFLDKLKVSKNARVKAAKVAEALA